MKDFFAERIAAGLVGTGLGFILTLTCYSLLELGIWFLLIIPLTCGLLAFLLGDRILDGLTKALSGSHPLS